VNHPHEAHYLKLDVSRARFDLGWEPLVPLANALDWTLDWYRGFQSGVNLESVTRSQIEQYEKLTVN
jgi:CDP-glucose 4,6-dehydratase